MISDAVDIVTSLAIISIAAILTVYTLILKKNGWIGKTSNYRCPNPECKKIFHSPLKVKDYSSKKIAKFACPECGCDLGPSKDAKLIMENNIENKTEAEPQNSPDIFENKILETKMENEETETIKQDSPTVETIQNRIPLKEHQKSKEVILERKIDIEASLASTLIEPETFITLKHSEKTKSLADTSENYKSLNESKNFKKVNRKKMSGVKKEKPIGCNNYFGYLCIRPKGGATPDECYACAKLIDCYKESTA